jgi:hypothetical protein
VIGSSLASAGRQRFRKLARANASALASLAAVLTVSVVNAQDVFKWVDKNGIVNYGDAVPDGIENFERVVIVPAPAMNVVPTRAAALPPLLPAAQDPVVAVVALPVEPEPVIPPPSEMSLADLDLACEASREREIAPLRAAAIAECKAAPRANPAYCERFYSDFGDGGTTAAGVLRPRMFDDLPECVVAREQGASRRR